MDVNVININDDTGRKFLDFYGFFKGLIKRGRSCDLGMHVFKKEMLNRFLLTAGCSEQVECPYEYLDFQSFLFDGPIAFAGEGVDCRIKEITDIRERYKENNIGDAIVLFIGSMQKSDGFLEDFVEKWIDETTPVFILYFF